jgi:branched-chain amino acid transport system substrate-binding protein
MKRWVMGAVALVAATAGSAAAEPIRIGLIATLSGPSAVLGQDLLDGFKLGLDQRGGQLGGAPVELITGDDQLKPDVGKQLADRMLQRDRVDIVTGIVFSNVMEAVAPAVIRARTFLIGSNAAPSPMAGASCSPYFFNTAWQNDNTHEAMGKHLTDAQVKRVYLLAPNYTAGKDALAGFKRFYKGEVIGERLTTLNQPDYAAELAEIRAAAPDAIYAFYPGGMAVNFVKQYAQSGLKPGIPLFGPSFLLDETVFKAQGDAAVGLYDTSFWSATLNNPANQGFVAAFRRTYGRAPSPYAAQSYDAAALIDSALKATGGSVKNQDAFRAALRKAAFASVRGPFQFNNNHFPIQNFYLQKVEKLDDGSIGNVVQSIVFSGHKDAYAHECKMKW